MKIKLKTSCKAFLSDTCTPVSIYLRVRDIYPNSFLLESSDYHGNENSFSYICFDPIASIKLENEVITTTYPGLGTTDRSVKKTGGVIKALGDFLASFETVSSGEPSLSQGVFGYMAYESLRYFEDIKLKNKPANSRAIPDLFYCVFRFVIVINHFNNRMYLQMNSTGTPGEPGIERVMDIIRNRNYPSYHYKNTGEEECSCSDAEFLKSVRMAKAHCRRGDVFQLVLSRSYSASFSGDEFNVYRALRSINPSPYLFFFDCGDFKLFGSSPEAQMVIKGEKATIYPIAGTYRRTGDDPSDVLAAKALKADVKEHSEHVMLVDLARNDLSRNGSAVSVDKFKELQYYSHVIHLVSEVSAQLDKNADKLKMIAEAFPAGTLTGAPKYKAMQLIDRYEPEGRGFYGGCIGYLGFNGDFNHAILIRSFMSRNKRLYYRAGAGIVAQSVEERELQEVNNKLAALKNAMDMAQNI